MFNIYLFIIQCYTMLVFLYKFTKYIYIFLKNFKLNWKLKNQWNVKEIFNMEIKFYKESVKFIFII